MSWKQQLGWDLHWCCWRIGTAAGGMEAKVCDLNFEARRRWGRKTDQVLQDDTTKQKGRS